MPQIINRLSSRDRNLIRYALMVACGFFLGLAVADLGQVPIWKSWLFIGGNLWALSVLSRRWR